MRNPCIIRASNEFFIVAGPMAAFDAPEIYGGPVGPQPTAAPAHVPFYPAAEQPPFYAAPVRRPADPA